MLSGMERSSKRQKLGEDGDSLSDALVDKINKRLMAMDDNMGPCHDICKQFKVTRRQLISAGFAVSPPGRLCMVAPQGFPEPLVEEPGAPEELTEAQKKELISWMGQNGDVVDMSQIGSRFKHKAAQLELAGFVLSEKNSHGQRYVAPPGSAHPEPPVEGASGFLNKEARTAKDTPGRESKGGKSGNKGFGGCKGINPMQLMAMAMFKGKAKGMGMNPAMMMGMMGGMGGWGKQGGGKANGKGSKGKGGQNNEPLSESETAEVMSFLEENGGPCSVSVVGAKVKNLTKARLVKSGFVIGPANEHGQSNIAAPGSAVPDPPLHMPKLKEA